MADKLFIICLIESVRKHPCLWDPTSVWYAKSDKLEKAWQEISQECGHPVNICRDKWKNVRTGFLTSLLEYSGNATAVTMKRKPFYYDNMQFLVPSILCSATSSQHSLSELPMLVAKFGRYGTEVVKMVEASNSDLLEEYEESSSPRQLEPSDMVRKKLVESEEVTCDDDNAKFDSREELALMSFFKGIASDILSLPLGKQRLFKRKIVELVDDLHDEKEETDGEKVK